jgi:hypothetical protein
VPSPGRRVRVLEELALSQFFVANPVWERQGIGRVGPFGFLMILMGMPVRFVAPSHEALGSLWLEGRV